MTASSTEGAAVHPVIASSRETVRRGLATRLSLTMILILLCSTVACRRNKERSLTEVAVRFFEAPTAGNRTRETHGGRCATPYALTLLGFKTIGTGCWRTVADSLFYDYAGANGNILLRGKRFSVSAERLSSLTDSLQRALRSRFGSSTDCKTANEVWNTTTFSYWRREGQTFFLRSTIASGRETSTITLEAALGERTCDMYVGGPPTYY